LIIGLGVCVGLEFSVISDNPQLDCGITVNKPISAPILTGLSYLYCLRFGKTYEIVCTNNTNKYVSGRWVGK